MSDALWLMVFKGQDEYLPEPLYEVEIYYEPFDMPSARWFFPKEEYAAAYARTLYYAFTMYDADTDLLQKLIGERPDHGLDTDDIRPKGYCIEEWTIIDGIWRNLQPRQNLILPRWKHVEV